MGTYGCSILPTTFYAKNAPLLDKKNIHNVRAYCNKFTITSKR